MQDTHLGPVGGEQMATQECSTGKAGTIKNLRTESVGMIFIQVRKACVHIIKLIDTMVLGHLPPRMFPGPKVIRGGTGPGC